MLKITNDMEEIINQDNAVVAFTATWCQPCKALKPQFAKAAVIDKDTPYYVVDVDQIDSIHLSTYGIQSIPQVFEMNKGLVATKITGKTSDAILGELGKSTAA
jgi:thioredoxin-like negative regulator of GroEL